MPETPNPLSLGTVVDRPRACRGEVEVAREAADWRGAGVSDRGGMPVLWKLLDMDSVQLVAHLAAYFVPELGADLVAHLVARVMTRSLSALSALSASGQMPPAGPVRFLFTSDSMRHSREKAREVAASLRAAANILRAAACACAGAMGKVRRSGSLAPTG